MVPVSTDSPTAQPAWKVHVALLGAQLFFASLSVVGKEIIAVWPWIAFVTLRVVLTAVLFFGIYLLAGAERVARRDLWTLALYGFLGVAANQFLFVAGLSRTKATHATVLVTSIPVFTAALSALLGREKLIGRKWLGIGVSMSGALSLVLISALASGKDLSIGAGQALGNLLIVSNSLSYSLYLVLSKDLLVRYQALTVSGWMFFFGALQGLFFDGVLALMYPAEASAAVAQVLAAPLGIWLRMAYVVLIATGLSYWLNAWALRHAPTSLVAVYVYLQPVVAAVLAWFILGERLHAPELGAAALVFAGVWMVARASHANPRPAPAHPTQSNPPPS